MKKIGWIWEVPYGLQANIMFLVELLQLVKSVAA